MSKYLTKNYIYKDRNTYTYILYTNQRTTK